MMSSTEPEGSIPIESEDASASLSMSDINIVEKGGSSRELFDETENSNSEHLPTVEEVRASMGSADQTRQMPRSRSRAKCALLICIPLMLIAVAVAIAVSVVASDDSEESSSQVTDTGPSSPNYIPVAPMPTAAAPAPPPVTQGNTEPADDEPQPVTFDQIVNWLSASGIASQDSLTTLGTPQNRAASWLANEDIATLPLPTGSIADTTTDPSGYLYMTRYVMALIHYQMNGENWAVGLNFMSPDPVCMWNEPHYLPYTYEMGGLLCDPDTQLPKELDLEYNSGMAGDIPTEIGLLTTLKRIDLTYNLEISGNIPTEICKLTNLEILLLSGNQLQGEIPSCIAELRRLQQFKIPNNKLEGLLPANVCGMIDMTSLVLDANFFEGPIPDCISQWTSLTTLSLSDNYLTGELPAKLTNLVNLTNLYVDGNTFKGDPTSIVNELISLKTLYLEDNSFSGVIDENFCKDLLSLEILDISSNNFASTDYGIPVHLFSLPQLRIVDVSDNSLKGNLPSEIPYNKDLAFLAAHQNQMTGGIPGAIANLTALIHLDLSDNGFHGPLRQELFEMPSLLVLFLANNPLLHEGPVPSALADMTQLAELSLKNTNRTGPLPELLDFRSLVLLDLDNNKFTGAIPANYGQLLSLQHLLLNRNTISGALPVFNATLGLTTVLLDGTDVTGDFSSICGLPLFLGLQAPQDESGIQSGADVGVIMVANCDNSGSDGGTGGIQCECCHCCNAEDLFCSDPLVASLDWTWESQFRRKVRDFGLNASTLLAQAPQVPDP